MKHVAKSILLALPFMLFIWLLALDIRPRGEQVIHYDIGDRSPFVTSLQPAERVEGGTLLADPVYLTLQTPNADFTSLTVDIDFKPGDAEVIEFGPSANIFTRSFDLQPVYHKVLEELDWFGQEKWGATLYSKDVIPFEGLEIPFSEVRTYRANWLEYPDVRAAFGSFELEDAGMRGYHKLVFAIPEGLGTVTVEGQDLNEVAGDDDVTVRLVNDAGDLVSETVLKDTERSSDTFSLELDGGFVSEGIYTLELIGTSDIVFDRVAAPYRYAVLEDRLALGDTAEGRSWYTNARELKLRATSSAGLGTVRMGTDTLELVEVGEWVYWQAPSKVNNRLVLTGGGVEVVGDGYFSEGTSSFFEPNPLTLTSINSTQSNVEYILSSYEKAQRTEDRWNRSITIDPNLYADENGVITFAFSVPSLTDAFNGDYPEIESINFTFKRRPLTLSQLIDALKARITFL